MERYARYRIMNLLFFAGLEFVCKRCCIQLQLPSLPSKLFFQHYEMRLAKEEIGELTGVNDHWGEKHNEEVGLYRRTLFKNKHQYHKKDKLSDKQCAGEAVFKVYPEEPE